MAGIVSRPPSFGEADGRHDGSTHESGDIGSADLEHVPNNRLLERKQHREMAISNPSDPLVLQRDIWSWAEISQALEASFAMGSVGGSLVALLVAEERQCRLQVDRR